MNKIKLIILISIIITITYNANSEESGYIKNQIARYTIFQTVGELVCIGGIGAVGYGIYKMNSSPKTFPIYNSHNAITGYMTLDNPKYTGRNFIIAGIITAIGGTYIVVNSGIKLKYLKSIKLTTSNNGIQFTCLF
jgi:hypothetical protein